MNENNNEFNFIKINENDGIEIPTYSTLESACFDFYSTIDDVVKSKSMCIIPLGLSVKMPFNYELQIRPRSSLAMKGLIIPNSPATIDSDYKDEIKVILYNLTDEDIKIKKNDKIAQGLFNEIRRIFDCNVRIMLNDRVGGFGSTGK